MKAKNNKSFTRHVTRTGSDKSWQGHVRGTKWMVGGHLEKDNLSSTLCTVEWMVDGSREGYKMDGRWIREGYKMDGRWIT